MLSWCLELGFKALQYDSSDCHLKVPEKTQAELILLLVILLFEGMAATNLLMIIIIAGMDTNILGLGARTAIHVILVFLC